MRPPAVHRRDSPNGRVGSRASHRRIDAGAARGFRRTGRGPRAAATARCPPGVGGYPPPPSPLTEETRHQEAGAERADELRVESFPTLAAAATLRRALVDVRRPPCGRRSGSRAGPTCALTAPPRARRTAGVHLPAPSCEPCASPVAKGGIDEEAVAGPRRPVRGVVPVAEAVEQLRYCRSGPVTNTLQCGSCGGDTCNGRRSAPSLLSPRGRVHLPVTEGTC